MRSYKIALVIAALSLAGWCQESDQQRVPTTLTADVPEIVTGENVGNQLTFAVTGGTVWDDNILSARADRMSDYRYFFAPSIKLEETRKRYRWNVQYEAGLSGYAQLSSGVQSDHAFSGTFAFNPVPRLTVRLRQDYLRSIDPFSAINSPNPDLGITNSLNGTIVAPSSLRTVLTSVAEIEYATTQHSKLGATGTFTKSDFSDLQNITPTFNPMSGNTVNGSLYFSIQTSRRTSFGTQYVLENMTYQDSPARAQTHSFLGYTTLGIDAHSTIMLYAGPQLTRTSGSIIIEEALPGAVVRDSKWSPIVGGIYSWAGSRTQFGASGSYRVSDGGGILNAATVTSGTFSAGRQFSRSWSGRTEFTLARNESAGLFALNGELRSLIARAEIQHRFTDNFEVTAGYDRVYQDGTQAYAGIGNHNRVQLSLRYFMTRPLGK